ncbi:lactoylglutathione lyase-like protein [Mycena maculata]|uniref:Lactoylglutathione lyase n=1 Tax=Mycena maculata TaxID=230809 RepID=A0AAD7IJS8_9AGAR|nr:lactoylglutathione lyase-like protein [Mycena maculata]
MAAKTDPSRYKLNHTMLRVKDPQKSIAFYELLGMKNIKTLPQSGFTLYFLAYDGPAAISTNKVWTDREGVIELTHNHGTEKEDTEEQRSFKYDSGNTTGHRGFGHVCISVDNLQAACHTLLGDKYDWVKKLDAGNMKHIAFVKDPDGYWVELISFNDVEKTKGIEETDPVTYRMNHTMIRVKNIDASLAFYEDVLGMKVKRKSEHPGGKFNLYFLGYGDTPANSGTGANPLANTEGLLELTWNYTLEGDKKVDAPEIYYNGNEAGAQGFGHICVTVDNLDAAFATFEKKVGEKVYWAKMPNVAWILDPDGYRIEILQNEGISLRAGW